MVTKEKQKLNRDQIAAVIARHFEAGWIVNLGVGIPTLASNYIDPDADVLLTSENGVLGYGHVAPEGTEDLDVVNGGGDYVTLNPGAAIVHHADSFALIRRGMLDCTVLGAYQVAVDGSFANWKTDWEYPSMGGIGGAMDLSACAKQVFVAMEHTTRDGQPRLLEHCTLPVTNPFGVTLVVTELAVIRVSDGQFILAEHAPGYTLAEIQAVTGAPLQAGPDLKPIGL